MHPWLHLANGPDPQDRGLWILRVIPNHSLQLAWESFGFRKGAEDRSSFFTMLGRFTAEQLAKPLACVLLLDVPIWPDDRWILWGHERAYADTGVQVGRTDSDSRNGAELLGAIRHNQVNRPTNWPMTSGSCRRTNGSVNCRPVSCARVRAPAGS